MLIRNKKRPVKFKKVALSKLKCLYKALRFKRLKNNFSTKYLLKIKILLKIKKLKTEHLKKKLFEVFEHAKKRNRLKFIEKNK